MNSHFDVVIVGAGIAGASLAWRLCAERSVLLVERESQPGYHSTGRSAAMFMESYGPPMARALTRASRVFYDEPLAGFSEHRILRPRGVLYVANRGQEVLLEQTFSDLRATGTVADLIGAAETCSRVSCLRDDLVLGAIHEPDAADIEVQALHQAYLQGARQRGVRLLVNASLGDSRWDERQWNLQLNIRANGSTDGFNCSTHVIVNAAGAWADIFAEQIGAQQVGLQPKRRSAFTFSAPSTEGVSQWPLVLNVDESFYFKPDAGQMLGSPANADAVLPHDVVPEELDIATGIYQIEANTTLTIQRPTSIWAGLRTFSRDGELVIGWDAKVPRFFWLAGQGGYGIQSAAGAAELAAALILDNRVPQELLAHGIDAALMSPNRF